MMARLLFNKKSLRKVSADQPDVKLAPKANKLTSLVMGFDISMYLVLKKWPLTGDVACGSDRSWRDEMKHCHTSQIRRILAGAAIRFFSSGCDRHRSCERIRFFWVLATRFFRLLPGGDAAAEKHWSKRDLSGAAIWHQER
jgi:hypothetical protein